MQNVTIDKVSPESVSNHKQVLKTITRLHLLNVTREAVLFQKEADMLYSDFIISRIYQKGFTQKLLAVENVI